MKENAIITKFIVTYLGATSLFVSLMLVLNIAEILNKWNPFFLLMLFIMLFWGLINVAFLFKGKKWNNLKGFFLINSILSIVFAFKINFLGLMFDDQIGTQLSAYYIKNSAGSDGGIRFDWFNVSLICSGYDTIKYPGCSFDINMLNIFIGVYFAYFYRRHTRLSLQQGAAL